MADVFSQLLKASFRGLPLYASAIRTKQPQGLARHRFPHRAGAIIEPTGPEEVTFVVTCHFRQAVDPKAFPDGFRAIFQAYRDTSPGAFVHPEYGTITVIPGSWEDELVAEKRDGLDVQLEFVEDNNALEKAEDRPTIFTAEAAIRQGEVSPPPSPAPGRPSFLEVAKGLLGRVQQAQIQASQAQAALGGVVRLGHDTVKVLEKTGDYASAMNVVRAGRSLARAIKAPSIKREILRTALPPVGIAALVGISLDELLKLNPKFVGLVVVPAGTPVFYR